MKNNIDYQQFLYSLTSFELATSARDLAYVQRAREDTLELICRFVMQNITDNQPQKILEVESYLLCSEYKDIERIIPIDTKRLQTLDNLLIQSNNSLVAFIFLETKPDQYKEQILEAYKGMQRNLLFPPRGEVPYKFVEASTRRFTQINHLYRSRVESNFIKARKTALQHSLTCYQQLQCRALGLEMKKLKENSLELCL